MDYISCSPALCRMEEKMKEFFLWANTALKISVTANLVVINEKCTLVAVSERQ